MFTQLYYVIFPFFGKFFGSLATLAQSDFNSVFQYFLSFANLNTETVSLISTNLFDGSIHVISSFVWSVSVPSLNVIFLGLRWIVQGLYFLLVPEFVRSLPFWMGCLSLSISVWFSFMLIKLVISIWK